MVDSIPDDEKSHRLQILQERQREIQRANYENRIGRIYEVMVEGKNEARGQVIGPNQPEHYLELHRCGKFRSFGWQLC